MSIIWEIVSNLLSGLPIEKIVKPIALKTVEKPPVSDYPSDLAHDERSKKLIERNRRFSDPIYKKNVEGLIERNRQFEKEQ